LQVLCHSAFASVFTEDQPAFTGEFVGFYGGAATKKKCECKALRKSRSELLAFSD
jgi:hypothetical protein